MHCSGRAASGPSLNYGVWSHPSERAKVDRRIVGFHQDDDLQWVAELECGHDQHVRHNPPWINRVWVTTLEGRTRTLGEVLQCKKCDEGARDRFGAAIEQTP